MERFIGRIKFFLLWLLFIAILPFGLVVFILLLFMYVPVMLFPNTHRAVAEDRLSDMLADILVMACEYADLMESCIVKD